MLWQNETVTHVHFVAKTIQSSITYEQKPQMPLFLGFSGDFFLGISITEFLTGTSVDKSECQLENNQFQ